MSKPVGKSIYKWSAIDRITNAAMTFAGNIVLARLLDPTDFGLVATVAIFIAIAFNISSCGLSDGLIHKLSPTKEDYSTVFTINSALGLLFGIIFILTAPLVANFFGHPQLHGIMIAIGICLFFQTMSFVQETRLRKELDMRTIAYVKICATAVSLGLGIVLALIGLSYWGIVSARIFLGFFQFLFYSIAMRWLPRLAFYKASFQEMFGYGFNLMLAYIINQCSRSINATILGKFSPATAGIYSQAQKLEEVPFGITESIFSGPFFPVIANQEDQNVKVSLALNMHDTILYVNCAIGVLLVLIAPPGINFVYGSQWDAVVPILQILVAYGIFYSIKLFYQTILKAYTLTNIVRNLNILEFVLQIGLLCIFYKQGIVMIVLTQIVSSIIVTSIHMLYFKHCLQLTASTIFRLYAGPFGIGLLTLAISAPLCCFYGACMNPLLDCLATLATFICVMGLCMYLFNRKMLFGIIEMIASKIHHK